MAASNQYSGQFLALLRGKRADTTTVACESSTPNPTSSVLEPSSHLPVKLTIEQQHEFDSIKRKYKSITEDFENIIADEISIPDKNSELSRLWSDLITLHSRIERLLEAVPEHQKLNNLRVKMWVALSEMRMDIQGFCRQQDPSLPERFGQPAAESVDNLIRCIGDSIFHDIKVAGLEFLEIPPPALPLPPKFESCSVSFFSPRLSSRQSPTSASSAELGAPALLLSS